MAKCPKCSSEIDCLISQELDIVSYRFDGKDYEEVDREANTYTDPIYTCPICNEVLANSEKQAKQILEVE